MTLESFENRTLCLARSRHHLSFVGLCKNTANDKEARQDDRVQACLLSYIVEGITHFLLGKTSRISASRFSSS